MNFDLEAIASISTIFFGFVETLIIALGGFVAYKAFIADKPIKAAEADNLEAKTHTEEMNSLRALFDTQKETNLTLREEILGVKADLIESNKQSNLLRRDLNEQVEARRTLERAKEAEAQKHLKEREELNLQLESLRSDLNSEREQRSKQVSGLEEKNRKLQKQVDDLTEEVNKLRQENELLREENERLKKLNGEEPCDDPQ